MKSRDVLGVATRALPGWHVDYARQFGRITAYDPQAEYEVTIELPDDDAIRIIRTWEDILEDSTVLNVTDMGMEPALEELAHILKAPMPRADRLKRLRDGFGKTAEWCREVIHDEQMARDTEDMAERFMLVCESCDRSPGCDPMTVFGDWLLGEELGASDDTRRKAASHMLADVRTLDREG